ncbi:hypothetical protein [Hymenobacter weizhouensis]|uniref:hypothetical protein n=1 Tax=Hymenobacter sp. YIM 151500-1 TaxID=2987689 RepID=UPI0022270EB9|nr:hypothetical protein [Hymenobacter sp. YIM 151500-1]UYZ62378.1 hypothetical protein OIS53_15425 [Hymenobacter sp. YIM 151500-1]
MFNVILPYRLVQRNRNRTSLGSWEFEWIYKFFIHSPDSRRKYLVEIRQYPGHLYTADFYAKVRNVHRYRLRTHQHAAGKLGATVLDILARVIREDPQACFGFIAAAMLDETTDVSTKRFRLYTKMLEQKINPLRHAVIERPETSSIFVQPLKIADNEVLKEQIISRYENIFRETF